MVKYEWLFLGLMVLPGGCCTSSPPAPAPTKTAAVVRLPEEDGAKIGVQGAIESTGRPFDLAICGNGFLHVKIDPEIGGGNGYTRKCALRLDENGELITVDGGHDLMPNINLPKGATAIDIALDGTVSFLPVGTTKRAKAGQIWLTSFVNPLGLRAESSGLYTATDRSGMPIENPPGENGAGELISGSRETDADEPVVDTTFHGPGLRFNTCRSLDVAIEGDGFFHVKMPHGVQGDDGYTRFGRLVVDANGDLAVSAADLEYTLVPKISVPAPANDIAIDADGSVSYCRLGGPRRRVGRVELVTFGKHENVQVDSDGIFPASAPNFRAVVKRDGRLLQGFLETCQADPEVPVARGGLKTE